MNAQTRRALVNKYVALIIDGHGMHSTLDALVCEWGLEMAKIAEQLDDYNNVGIARRITAANDQQKGA